MTSSINMLNWNSHQNLNNISFIEVEFIAQLLYLLCSVPGTLSMFSCSPPSFHHANLFLFLSISPLSLSVSIPLMTQVSRIKYYTQEGLLKQYIIIIYCTHVSLFVYSTRPVKLLTLLFILSCLPWWRGKFWCFTVIQEVVVTWMCIVFPPDDNRK